MLKTMSDGGIRMLTAVLSFVTTIENVDDNSANNKKSYQ